MQIKRVLAVPAMGAYYCEDVLSLQENPVALSQRYHTPSNAVGFQFLREPGEGVSLGLELQNGFVAWGDCISVCYAGKTGRDPVFRTQHGMEEIEKTVRPFLLGRSLTSFREIAHEMQKLGPLHNAVRYGASQALLSAVAEVKKCTMTEVICREWDLPIPTEPVPIHAVTGTNRYEAIDRMVARKPHSLPHYLVDDMADQVGEGGVKLIEYVGWLSAHIQKISKDYHPILHLDVHGAIGKVFGEDPEKVTDHLLKMEKAASPFALRMESVVLGKSREDQIERMLDLKTRLKGANSKIELVVDEWANTREDVEAFAKSEAADLIHIKTPDLGGIEQTIEAVLFCKKSGVGAYLGGTVNETDLSAKACVHVALATRPAVLMARPGMGIDEGMMLVTNEMNRTLALLK